jgi:hypothetical protein
VLDIRRLAARVCRLETEAGGRAAPPLPPPADDGPEALAVLAELREAVAPLAGRFPSAWSTLCGARQVLIQDVRCAELLCRLAEARAGLRAAAPYGLKELPCSIPIGEQQR